MDSETLCRANAETCKVSNHQEKANTTISIPLSSLVSKPGCPNSPTLHKRISGYSAQLKLRKVESRPLFQVLLKLKHTSSCRDPILRRTLMRRLSKSKHRLR